MCPDTADCAWYAPIVVKHNDDGRLNYALILTGGRVSGIFQDWQGQIYQVSLDQELPRQRWIDVAFEYVGFRATVTARGSTNANPIQNTEIFGVIPATGHGRVVVGSLRDSVPALAALTRGFTGWIDEVRIHEQTLSALAPADERLDGCTLAAGDPPTAHFALDDRTLALWRFDEGCGGIARDASANHHDLRVREAAWTAGAAGSSLSWESGNQEVMTAGPVVTGHLPGDRLLTLEAMILLPDSLSTDSNATVIVGKPWMYMLGIRDGRIAAYFNIGTLTSKRGSRPIPRGRWTRIAAQFADNAMSLWIDGELDTVFANPTPDGEILYDEAQPLFVGGILSSAGSTFRGRIDEIRVSREARHPLFAPLIAPKP